MATTGNSGAYSHQPARMAGKLLHGFLLLLVFLKSNYAQTDQGGTNAGDVVSISGTSIGTSEGPTGTEITIILTSPGEEGTTGQPRDIWEVEEQDLDPPPRRWVVEDEIPPIFCRHDDYGCDTENGLIIRDDSNALVELTAGQCLFLCVMKANCRGYTHGELERSCELHYFTKCRSVDGDWQGKNKLVHRTDYNYYYRLAQGEYKSDCPALGSCDDCPTGPDKVFLNHYCYEFSTRADCSNATPLSDPVGYYAEDTTKSSYIECSKYCSWHPFCRAAIYDARGEDRWCFLYSTTCELTAAPSEKITYLERMLHGDELNSASCRDGLEWLDADASKWSGRFCRGIGMDCPKENIYRLWRDWDTTTCLQRCNNNVACQSAVVCLDDTPEETEKCHHKLERCDYGDLIENDRCTEYYKLRIESLEPKCPITRSTGTPPSEYQARFCKIGTGWECPQPEETQIVSESFKTDDLTACLLACATNNICGSASYKDNGAQNQGDCVPKTVRCLQQNEYRISDGSEHYQRLRNGEECEAGTEVESQWSARFCFGPDLDCVAIADMDDGPEGNIGWQECLRECYFRVGCRAVQLSDVGVCRLKAGICGDEEWVDLDSENAYTRLNFGEDCEFGPVKPTDCPDGSTASDSAPGCPKSCQEMNDKDRAETCTFDDNPGCVCDDSNQVWDHVTETCINKEDCPCYDDDGNTWEVDPNTSWRSLDCTETYRCILDDGEPTITVEPTPCDPVTEECDIVGETPTCTCAVGYEPSETNPDECVPEVDCPANSWFDVESSTCQRTCGDTTDRSGCDPIIGCTCEPTNDKPCLVWKSGDKEKCIHQKRCGCANGKAFGDEWYGKVGKVCYKYKCQPENDVNECVSVGGQIKGPLCDDTHQYCELIGDGYKCKCDENFIMHQGECVEACPSQTTYDGSRTICQAECNGYIPSDCGFRQKFCRCPSCEVFDFSTNQCKKELDLCGCGEHDGANRKKGDKWRAIVDGVCKVKECPGGYCKPTVTVTEEEPCGDHNSCTPNQKNMKEEVCECDDGYKPVGSDSNGDCEPDINCRSGPQSYDPSGTCQEICGDDANADTATSVYKKCDNDPEMKFCRCDACQVYAPSAGNLVGCRSKMECGCGFLHGARRQTGDVWYVEFGKVCVKHTCEPDEQNCAATHKVYDSEDVCTGDDMYCEASDPPDNNYECKCENDYVMSDNECKEACPADIGAQRYDEASMKCQPADCETETTELPCTSYQHRHCICPICFTFDTSEQKCRPMSTCGCGLVDTRYRYDTDEWKVMVGDDCVQRTCNYGDAPDCTPNVDEVKPACGAFNECIDDPDSTGPERICRCEHGYKPVDPSDPDGDCEPGFECQDPDNQTYKPDRTTCQEECGADVSATMAIYVETNCDNMPGLKYCECGPCQVFDRSSGMCKSKMDCGCGYQDGRFRYHNNEWRVKNGDSCAVKKCMVNNEPPCDFEVSGTSPACGTNNECVDDPNDTGPDQICKCVEGYELVDEADPNGNCEPSVDCKDTQEYCATCDVCQPECGDDNPSSCGEKQKKCLCKDPCDVFDRQHKTCVRRQTCGCGVVDGAERVVGVPWKALVNGVCRTRTCTADSQPPCNLHVENGDPACVGTNKKCGPKTDYPDEQVCTCENGYELMDPSNPDTTECVPEVNCKSGQTYSPSSVTCQEQCGTPGPVVTPSDCSIEQKVCLCDDCQVFDPITKSCKAKMDCGCGRVDGAQRYITTPLSTWIQRWQNGDCVEMSCVPPGNPTTEPCSANVLIGNPTCVGEHKGCTPEPSVCNCENGYHLSDPSDPLGSTCDDDVDCEDDQTYTPDATQCQEQCGETDAEKHPTSCSPEQRVCVCNDPCSVFDPITLQCKKATECGCYTDEGKKNTHDKWNRHLGEGKCVEVECEAGKDGCASTVTYDEEEDLICQGDHKFCNHAGETPFCDCEEGYHLADQNDPESECEPGVTCLDERTQYKPERTTCQAQCNPSPDPTTVVPNDCSKEQIHCECPDCHVFDPKQRRCVAEATCGCGVRDGQNRELGVKWISGSVCNVYECVQRQQPQEACAPQVEYLGPACTDDEVCDTNHPGDPTCECPEHYIRNQNDQCVPFIECPLGSEFRDDLPICWDRIGYDVTTECPDLQKFCPCTAQCHVWDKWPEDKCVPAAKTGCGYQNGKKRETDGDPWIVYENGMCVWKRCESRMDDPEKCYSKVVPKPEDTQQEACIDDNEMCDTSVPGADPFCRCEDGYFRENGECKPVTDCSTAISDVPVEYVPGHSTCFDRCPSPGGTSETCNLFQRVCKCDPAECLVWESQVSNKCVKKHECGCIFNGIVYAHDPNTKVIVRVSGECRHLTCTADDNDCEPKVIIHPGDPCDDPHQMCTTSGPPKCVCEPGYKEEDDECVPTQDCPDDSEYYPLSTTCGKRCEDDYNDCSHTQLKCHCDYSKCLVWKSYAENTCVHQKMCGCMVDGVHRPLYDSDDSSRWIKQVGDKCYYFKCKHDEKDGCEAVPKQTSDEACDGPYETCDTSRSGDPVCRCIPGYEYNGQGVCEPEVTCPANSVYMYSLPSPPAYPPTVCTPRCGDIAPTDDNCNMKQLRCKCDHTQCMVWRSPVDNTCVHQSECGCLINGVHYDYEEPFIHIEYVGDAYVCKKYKCGKVEGSCEGQKIEQDEGADQCTQSCESCSHVQGSANSELGHCVPNTGYHYEDDICVPDKECPSGTTYLAVEPSGGFVCQPACHDPTPASCNPLEKRCKCPGCEVWSEGSCVHGSNCGCKDSNGVMRSLYIDDSDAWYQATTNGDGTTTCHRMICEWKPPACSAQVKNDGAVCDGDHEFCYTGDGDPECACEAGYHYETDANGDPVCEPDVLCPSGDATHPDPEYHPASTVCGAQCHDQTPAACPTVQIKCHCPQCYVYQAGDANVCVPIESCGCKDKHKVYPVSSESNVVQWPRRKPNGDCVYKTCVTEKDTDGCNIPTIKDNGELCPGDHEHCAGDFKCPRCDCDTGYIRINGVCEQEFDCPDGSEGYDPSLPATCNQSCFARQPDECTTEQKRCHCSDLCHVWTDPATNECKHKKDCGCIHNGNHYYITNTWIVANGDICELWTCSGPERGDCAAYAHATNLNLCTENEVCETEAPGAPYCRCKTGFSPDDSGVCTEDVDCPAYSDHRPDSDECFARCFDEPTPSHCDDIQEHCECTEPCHVWAAFNDDRCIDKALCGCMVDGVHYTLAADGTAPGPSSRRIVAVGDKCKYEVCRRRTDACGAEMVIENKVCPSKPNEICDTSGDQPFCRCDDGYIEENGECKPRRECPPPSTYEPDSRRCNPRCWDMLPTDCTQTQYYCECGRCECWKSETDHTCVKEYECGCMEDGVLHEYKDVWYVVVDGVCEKHSCVEDENDCLSRIKTESWCTGDHEHCHIPEDDGELECHCDPDYKRENGNPEDDCVPAYTCPPGSMFTERPELPEERTCHASCGDDEPEKCSCIQKVCECKGCKVWAGPLDNRCIHKKKCGCEHRGQTYEVDSGEPWIAVKDGTCVYKWCVSPEGQGCDAVITTDPNNYEACTGDHEKCDKSIRNSPECVCEDGYHYEGDPKECVPDVSCKEPELYDPEDDTCGPRCFFSSPPVTCTDVQRYCACDGQCQVYKNEFADKCVHAKKCGCLKDGVVHALDTNWVEPTADGKCHRLECVHISGCYAEVRVVDDEDDICEGEHKYCVQFPDEGVEPYCTCEYGYYLSGDDCLPNIDCPSGTYYDPHGTQCHATCSDETPNSCSDERKKCRCVGDCYVYLDEVDECVFAQECGCGEVDGKTRHHMDDWYKKVGGKCYHKVCMATKGSCYLGPHKIDEHCRKPHEKCVRGGNKAVCDCKHGYHYNPDGDCIPDCLPGEHFDENAPSCDDTCQKPDASQYCGTSREGRCVCDHGYQRDDEGNCVPPEQCPCVDGSDTYEIGTVHIGKDCQIRCECIIKDNRPRYVCDKSYSCPEHSYCCQDDGTAPECVCHDGYFMHDDGKCYEDCPDELVMEDLAIIVPPGSRVVLPIAPERDCPLDNSRYNHQASACQPTCYNRKNNENCPHAAEPGCECADGHVFEHILGRCIKPHECGCYDLNDKPHAVGDWWLSDDCSEIFMCQANDHGPNIQSQPYSCPDYSSCKSGVCDCNGDRVKQADGSCAQSGK